MNLDEVLWSLPRTGSKKQFALGIVTAAPDKSSFVLQVVQPISPEEVQPTIKLMKNLIAISSKLASVLWTSGAGKRPVWTSGLDNPIESAKKCRTLCRNPTDRSLDLTDE